MTNEEAIKHLQTYSTTMGSGQTTDEQHKEAKRMAIEALSNSQNQSNSLIRTSADAVSEADVIYRQDAITLPVMPKEYRKYQTFNLDDAYEQGWFDLQKCIKGMPSAHLVNDSQGFSQGDLISRQDAIDLWDRYHPYISVTAMEYDKALRSLPSAQPEIIRCKDCTYFEYDHVENVDGIPLIVAHEICNRWSDGVKTSESGFCFLAERRIDETD